MSVTDRWHKTFPRAGDEACGCGTRRRPLYPARGHGKGDRWQVRWYDDNGKQRARNFALKEGRNPELHADAYNKKVAGELLAGTYVDPKALRETFGKFAVEVWLEGRTHDKDATGPGVEGLLRNHVLEDPARPGSGLTRTGAPSLGHYSWAALQRFPSNTQKWMAGIRLAPSSATQVIRLASSVFIAAQHDGLISGNPTQSDAVTRPTWVKKKTRPWPAATVDAIAEGLGLQCDRYEALPYVGVATGLRAGEMFGLADADLGEPDFFRRQLLVQVRRQVRLVKGVRCYRPVKNEKEHAVPVHADMAEMLIGYMERFPPVAVTLPWMRPGGDAVTFRLLFTRPDGQAIHYNAFMDGAWKPALAHAGIIPPREPGKEWARSREDGPHRWRHTAVSQWLDGGAGLTEVAEWIGDDVKTVTETYAHMMPGADQKARVASARFFATLRPSARIMHSAATGRAK